MSQRRGRGSVLELENTIERAVVLSTSSTIKRDVVTMDVAVDAPAAVVPSLKLRQNVEWIERETIRRALESAPLKRQAARLMGISPRALSHYLAKYPLIAQSVSTAKQPGGLPGQPATCVGSLCHGAASRWRRTVLLCRREPI